MIHASPFNDEGVLCGFVYRVHFFARRRQLSRVSAVLGVASRSGWTGPRFRTQEGSTLPASGGKGTYEKVFLGIAVTITTIWATATIVQLIVPTRTVPETTNYVMIAVAGAFFGGSLLTKRNGEK